MSAQQSGVSKKGFNWGFCRAFAVAFILWLTILLSVLLVGGIAFAQGGFIQRPEVTRPKLPNFKPPRQTPGKVLPPIPIPKEHPKEGLYKGDRILIKKVIITGATVIPKSKLESIAAGLVKSKGHQLTLSDLEWLRDQITKTYIKEGFITSGAVIEAVVDGIVRIQIVEGVLDQINITTDGRLNERYISNMLRPVAKGMIVNQNQIAEQLQVLQQDPRIKQIKAELNPKPDQLGQSILNIGIHEAKAVRIGLQFDNLEPPSVGSYRGLLNFSDLNVIGFGDSLVSVARITEGLRGLYAMYEWPFFLTARGATLVDVHVDLSTDEVIEAPFDALDIKGDSETYGFGITQPLYHRLGEQSDHRFELFLIGDRRRSQSYLAGEGFPFSQGASPEGETRVTVLRVGNNWFYRTAKQAFALRNTFSFGLDMLDATISEDDDTPDGRFFSYMGQAQYARQLSFKGVNGQVVVRGDVQLAGEPLLSMEKIGVGGFATVRGYRQNELVRDNALIGSLEVRLPLPIFPRKWGTLELAPFYDISQAWDEQAPSEEAETLSGAGLGLRWTLGERAFAFLYWGHAFEDLSSQGEYNLQDDGIYFQIAAYF